MMIAYSNDSSIENALNEYVWQKANDYSVDTVASVYDKIANELKMQISEGKKPFYWLKKYYERDYRSNRMKELNLATIKTALDESVIFDLTRQFIYEAAVFKLINRECIIPAQSFNPHIEDYYNRSIAMEFNGSFGNSFCYLSLFFPYASFRISPFIATIA